MCLNLSEFTKIAPPPHPWITHEIIEAINDRNVLFQLAHNIPTEANVFGQCWGQPCQDTKWSKTLSGINIPLSIIMPLSATTRH